MAQIKPEYEVVDEFNTIATKIVEKHPNIFNGIKVDEIRCYAITNKERPEKKKTWEVKAVAHPVRIDCPYGWYAVVYSQDWEEMDEKHKALMVSAILCSIGEEGKVNPFDLKDYGVLVRTFGPDYLDKADIPDILKDNVDWVTRSNEAPSEEE